MRRIGAVLSVVTACVLAVAVAQPAAGQSAPDTGFTVPFSGAPGYEQFAPTEASAPDQVNRPLGQRAADDIARQIGLSADDSLSDQQYRDLVTGGGVGGDRDAARTIDECAWILTNTVGRPLLSEVDGEVLPTVLGSYGLYVNGEGLLQSPANADAPTRQVNTLIAPGGYVGNWLRDNGATRSLVALYRSAYTVQAVYGFAAQQISGAAQLVTNTRDGVVATVGMSMAPPLWIVNFALLYVLKPSFAAAMPAHWAPVPETVADAVRTSPTGQVPYGDYRSFFE